MVCSRLAPPRLRGRGTGGRAVVICSRSTPFLKGRGTRGRVAMIWPQFIVWNHVGSCDVMLAGCASGNPLSPGEGV